MSQYRKSWKLIAAPTPMQPPPLQPTITFRRPTLNFNLKWLLWIPVAIILLVGIFSSYYMVPPESKAVVRRFGKLLAITDRGLHFKLPFGIDIATRIPVRRQLKLEFGFNTPDGTNPYQESEEPELERDMVTGDLNAAQVEWIVQYSIFSPRDYLFGVRNPESTLRCMSESVMCEVIGDRTVDEVLTIGRTEIETEQVFITEFGKPIGQPINADPAKSEAGLHFKTPFVQQVNRIEKRILEWAAPQPRCPRATSFTSPWTISHAGGL